METIQPHQPITEQIEQWKKQHGRVFTTAADGMKAYFRKPTRKELSYAMAMQNKPLEMTEHIVKSCFLGGDRRLVDEVEYLLGSDKLVEKLLEFKTVELGEA